MPVLPAKGHTILLVHPNTVTTGLIAPQQFQAVSRRYRKIIETPCGINQLQLSLYDAPQVPRNASSAPGVSFSEQINCRFVSE